MSDGPVVLITGASRGLGRALGLECARRKMPVVLAARTLVGTDRSLGSLQQTADDVHRLGGSALTIQCDLSAADEVEAMAAEAAGWRQRVDVVINNAALLGRPTYHSLEELSLGNWNRQLQVNLTVPFQLSKLLAPAMRAVGRGAIVNLTSASADMQEGSLPGMCYGASKAALSRLTLALARDLRADGVAAFAVDPGYVRTEIAELAAVQSGMSIDDARDPAFVAAAIIDLVERPAASVTGRIFRVVDHGTIQILPEHSEAWSASSDPAE